MPWIMLRRMLGMTVHRWRHTRMHVHVTVWRWVIRWVLRHWGALVVTIIVIIIFVNWIHAVHLVSFSLVILFLISCKLFPGVSDQSSDRTTLRGNTGFGLLQTEDMSREEHVVTSLVALAICLFIWWLVFCHLLFITLAIFASSVGRENWAMSFIYKQQRNSPQNLSRTVPHRLSFLPLTIPSIDFQ